METQDAQVERSQEEGLEPSPVQWGQISNVKEIPATSLKAKLGVLAADSILKMRWRFRYSSRLLSKRPGLGPQLSEKKIQMVFLLSGLQIRRKKSSQMKYSSRMSIVDGKI